MSEDKFKTWTDFWFLNGGSFHGLWKRKKYTEIKELGMALPKMAWDEQQKKIDNLEKALLVSANQLEGVSIAIKAHGQNINTQFFIDEYEKMAQEARDNLAL